MRLEGDEISHVITIGEDVTESRRIQGQIMQSEKLAAIGQLAAGVMHEINNPLATISACVAAITGRLDEWRRRRTPLSRNISRSSTRKWIAAPASSTACSTSAVPRERPRAGWLLNALVDETLFLLKHHQRFKRLGLARELDMSLPATIGNAEQLTQVLMALMLNAVDAMDDRGKLTVRTGRNPSRSDEVVVEIEDNGIGIPRADQSKIFEPFYTTKPPGRGTGLGLSICYGIVEDHQRPDRGRQPAWARLHLPGVSAGAPMKILVVEDDRTVGQYVKRGLEEQRYHADLVDDGMEGLRLASGGRYDLIVLDLRLPEMNGLEVLRTLRDRGNTTPVLVLTAQDAVDFKVQALRAGADDYVTKPFAFEELLARVEALAAGPRRSARRFCAWRIWSSTPATREVQAGGRADRAHAQGIHRARVPHAPCGTGHVPDADHRVRLGLPLRSRHQHRRRGDQPPAQEGRLGPRAEAGAYGQGVGYVVKA